MIANPQFTQFRIIEMYLIFNAFTDDTFTIAAHHVRIVGGIFNENRRPVRFRLRRLYRIHKNIYTIFRFDTQNGRLVQFIRDNMNGAQDLGIAQTILMTLATTVNFNVVISNFFIETLNRCLHLCVVVAVVKLSELNQNKKQIESKI